MAKQHRDFAQMSEDMGMAEKFSAVGSTMIASDKATESLKTASAAAIDLLFNAGFGCESGLKVFVSPKDDHDAVITLADGSTVNHHAAFTGIKAMIEAGYPKGDRDLMAMSKKQAGRLGEARAYRRDYVMRRANAWMGSNGPRGLKAAMKADVKQQLAAEAKAGSEAAKQKLSDLNKRKTAYDRFVEDVTKAINRCKDCDDGTISRPDLRISKLKAALEG